jgi:hypothetical protein
VGIHQIYIDLYSYKVHSDKATIGPRASGFEDPSSGAYSREGGFVGSGQSMTACAVILTTT